MLKRFAKMKENGKKVQSKMSKFIINYGADIFTFKSDVLIHGCNCFNTMGSGVAKQIKKVLS